MKYVIYYPSGEIARVVSCPPEQLRGQLGDDGMLQAMAVEEDLAVSDLTHYVSHGELALFPSSPFPEAVWDWSTMSYPGKTLEQLKEAKRAEINSARLAANRSGFMFRGHLISTDELSRGDIDGTNGYVALNNELPVDWIGFWKADDNSYVAIATVEDWRALYAAMVAQGSQNFAIAQQLKAQLDAALTPAEVEAIAWPAVETHGS